MVVMITSEEYKELVIKANKYDEMQKAQKEPKHMKENITVHKITTQEMGQVLDNLKNKLMGDE